jgi:hypothetical protein
MPLPPTRRHILTGLSLAGAAGLLPAPRPAGAEAPLETTTVRITKDFAICEAPLYIAEELLRAEGFTDVRYIEAAADANSTKRVLRALLKATDLCGIQPASVAQRLVDGGFTPRYDYALQLLSELPYNKSHEYNAEDSFRYYALRLYEMGFVKANPQKIIADGTDWHFLNELNAS